MNVSVMSRGKLLHSGLSNIQVLQPSVDAFLDWTREIDNKMEKIEMEGQKLRNMANNRGNKKIVEEGEAVVQKKLKVSDGRGLCYLVTRET